MVEDLGKTKQWVLVKQIVRLLNTYAPNELKNFQASFPEYAEVLDWEDITDGQLLPVDLAMDICLVGLSIVIDVCKNKHEEIVKEVARIDLSRNKFHFIGGIGIALSIISNVFICIFLAYEYFLVVYLLVAIGLIGLLMVVIYLKDLNRNWSSIAMNLTSDFMHFHYWEIEAKTLYKELKHNKEIQDFSDNNTFVNKGNSIIKEVRAYIRILGYFKGK